jgi:DNA-binding transcriptional ArsR family regulator
MQRAEPSRARLDAVFSALAHPTRRQLIEQLASGDARVGELARPHRMSLPAISRHLRVLERAGLLSVTRDWRVHRCHVEAAAMSEAFGWMTQYRVLWEDRFARLDRHLVRFQQRGGRVGGTP